MTDSAARAPHTFIEQVIPVHDLYRELVRRGEAGLRGLTFVKCVIEGPAVLLISNGVEMDDCNMGLADGDVRNLLLRPVSGDKVVGAIPVLDCRFQSCRFHAVGFTGSEAYLEGFVRDVSLEGAPQ